MILHSPQKRENQNLPVSKATICASKKKYTRKLFTFTIRQTNKPGDAA